MALKAHLSQSPEIAVHNSSFEVRYTFLEIRFYCTGFVRVLLELRIMLRKLPPFKQVLHSPEIASLRRFFETLYKVRELRL